MWNLVGAALVAALPGASNLPNTESPLSLWKRVRVRASPSKGKGQSLPGPDTGYRGGETLRNSASPILFG